ncbi:unnamed protein product [Sphagnum jensenii]|uniref:Photosystem I subunit VII n=1 Tax=Sphagnum jensenii TaxID=128206 RepID=A0ABP0WQY8_9BRYO
MLATIADPWKKHSPRPRSCNKITQPGCPLFACCFWVAPNLSFSASIATKSSNCGNRDARKLQSSAALERRFNSDPRDVGNRTGPRSPL